MMRRLLIPSGLLLFAMNVSASTPCPSWVGSFTPTVLQQPTVTIQTTCQDIRANAVTQTAVVFANGQAARIVLLKPNTDGVSGTLVSAPRENMGDAFISIDSIDLNADGGSELVATFGSAHGSGAHNVWIYAVRDEGLVLISPSVRADGPFTEPEFVDLDGSGHLSIVDRKLDVEPDPDDTTGVSRLVTPSVTLYAWQNGTYAASVGAPLLFFGTYVRDTGTPASEDEYFAAQQASPGVVTVLNGRPGHPDEACESATVAVNGQEVFGPSDFKRKAYVLKSTTQVLGDNIVTVTLAGTPGCHAVVLVNGTE